MTYKKWGKSQVLTPTKHIIDVPSGAHTASIYARLDELVNDLKNELNNNNLDIIINCLNDFKSKLETQENG